MQAIIATTILHGVSRDVCRSAAWVDARDSVPQASETSLYECKTRNEGHAIPAMRRAIAGIEMWVSCYALGNDMRFSLCKNRFIVKIHSVAYWRRLAA